MRLIPSTCRSKVNYRRRKLALTRAGQVGQRAGIVLTAYHCAECHGWHLTHSLRRDRIRVAA